MSDNKKMNDFYIYRRDCLTNIEEGRYRIYNVQEPDIYSARKKWYILISDWKYIRNYRYCICSDEIDNCLYKNNIKLEKLEIIDKIKADDKFTDDMVIYKINEPSICNNYFICNKKTYYNSKEFFIEIKNEEKYEEYPLYIEIYNTKFNILTVDMFYNIYKFYLDKNNNINSIKSSTFHVDKFYIKPKNDDYVHINKRIKDILKTYFICKNDNIYCVYNDKKEIAKLTFITENIIETDDHRSILTQNLRLNIGDKKFHFYINNPKLIDYNKECKYCFLVMHIRSDPQLLSNNLILGYEFNQNKYYYLKYEERMILKNIDNEIAGKYINMKKQDLYTYLLSNNERCGMTINIDKDHNVTYKLVKLNDKCFEKLIDISLLKPVSEWNKELYEINNINNINEFDSIVEGFDN